MQNIADKMTAKTTDWHPACWRAYPVPQMPLYPDPAALHAAEAQLATAPPLVSAAACAALRAHLAAIGAGAGFLLQGGDCAESFEDFTPDRTNATVTLLQELATTLTGQITITARLAGQFAKPRSADNETRDNITLPAYRGDSINDFSFTAAARQPDPARMIRAYEQSATIHKLLPASIYTCHEALLLPYEEALTRRDEENGKWLASSAHFLWLGARTQKPDDAHVAWLRGIANPIGIKCAPWTDAESLLRLCDILNPDNEPGRLTLIPRMGATAIDECLPALIKAIIREKRFVTWCCDPMHGNTIRTPGGLKTRRIEDIKTELTRYFVIHAEHGTRPGGVHLELSGAHVTECTGLSVNEDELQGCYETRCDPRLNPAQARTIAAHIAAIRLKYSAAA